MATKEKTKAKEEVYEPTGKKIFVEFYESELPELGLDKTAKRREVSNAIRKKIGMEELKTIRSSKKRALKEKLGLPDTATQKDIDEAMMKKLE